MAQGPLDLAGEQIEVVAEVTLQRVTVDDDPILMVVARDTVPEVLAVRMRLIPEIGYHDRNLRQDLLEFNRQPIDCIDDHGFELVEFGSIGHASNDREPNLFTAGRTRTFDRRIMSRAGSRPWRRFVPDGVRSV